MLRLLKLKGCARGKEQSKPNRSGVKPTFWQLMFHPSTALSIHPRYHRSDLIRRLILIKSQQV
ncbi:hypothetical protein [Leptolyngbya ohadii]|uniref:hypothetical protein n=1 Tax=Leptolyngbya ohadii TaxID=1962290 RepID=UPI0019D484EB|nr:hypothetical protein [Leptolyngbya ohadii]